MIKDIFSAEVKLSGLKDKDEIKILICYLLCCIEDGLSKDEILETIHSNNLANYFDINDCLSDLISKNNITYCEKEKKFKANNETKMISERLESFIPFSVKDQAICAAIKLLEKIKRKKENHVEIQKNSNGFHVVCHVSGGNMELAQIKLYVPDMLQAKKVKDNFQKNPDIFYKCMLSLLADDHSSTDEIINKLDKH